MSFATCWRRLQASDVLHAGGVRLWQVWACARPDPPQHRMWHGFVRLIRGLLSSACHYLYSIPVRYHGLGHLFKRAANCTALHVYWLAPVAETCSHLAAGPALSLSSGVLVQHCWMVGMVRFLHMFSVTSGRCRAFMH